MEADAVELRILGCLIEKQRTTPDAYPLSLNALRLACNQSTNRDPVVDYDEATIRDGLHRLYRRRWTRLAGAGRAAKYRHLLDEALGLTDAELSLLAVLMLRGPQTPGELNQRVARLHPFAGIDAVQSTLDGLIRRELVERLPRRPGQKEERYVQRLGATDDAAPAAPAAAPVGSASPGDAEAAAAAGPRTAPGTPAPSTPAGDVETTGVAALTRRLDDLEHRLGERVADLERETGDLREQLRQLRADLGYDS